MVTIDIALLATSEGTSTTQDLSEQDLSAYLSRRFSIRPVAPTSSLLLPMREVSEEMDPLAPKEDSHPSCIVEPPPPPLTDNTAQRMLEALETTMSTQEQPALVPSTTIGEDVEAYLANMVTRGRQVVISAQTRALQTMVQELEQVLSFMRVGCPMAFSVCFEVRGWPNTETPEMRQEWIAKEPIVESRVDNLGREIV